MLISHLYKHSHRLSSRLIQLASTSGPRKSFSTMSFPQTIKAILVPKHGDVDVIELGDVPFPEQKPNEVLIKVTWTQFSIARWKP